MRVSGPAPGQEAPPIVLVVEDDLDVRDMYRTALELRGLWASEVADAAQAWAFAEDMRPDAIVTDLGLPDLDGVELARRIRSSTLIAHTPIVAVTGRDTASVLPADRALFDELLVKPIQLDYLVNRLHELIGERNAALRSGPEATRTRGLAPIEHSDRLRGRATELQSDATARPCPICGRPLTWVERRQLSGVTFDYYRTCEAGCGLVCFDHAGRRFVRLAG